MSGKSNFEIRVNEALEGIRDRIALSNAISGQDGFVETLQFSVVDFGAAATVETIRSPVGLRGRVLSVSIYDVTETFAVDANPARIDVGNTSADTPASDIDHYWTGEAIADTLAANGGEVHEGTFNKYIPADTDFTINKTLASDSGSVGGISKVNVTIAWVATES